MKQFSVIWKIVNRGKLHHMKTQKKLTKQLQCLKKKDMISQMCVLLRLKDRLQHFRN